MFETGGYVLPSIPQVLNIPVILLVLIKSSFVEADCQCHLIVNGALTHLLTVEIGNTVGNMRPWKRKIINYSENGRNTGRQAK